MKHLALPVAALMASLPVAALAEYPEQPVEFVVPFPPGDLEDILTRMIADEFQAEYGVAAAVVNKPGGGGGPFPGAAEVAAAPADGYTVGSFVIDIPLVGPDIGIPALSPNPFEPIGIFLTYPFVIAAAGDAPFSTMEELATYANENDVFLGHFGTFAVPTQVTFAMAAEMGFEWGAEAAFDALDCNALASGDVDVMNTTLQQIRPCLDDLTILASVGNERTELTPDVPTVAEITPDLNIALWNGLFVHADTPQDVRDKIAVVAERVMNSDEVQDLREQTGALIYWQDAEEATQQIEQDAETLVRVMEYVPAE
ncbi:tripartite tricarboxylate transporter substrate binding protein [Salipiger sp. IMCC34102]|uniref:tripartite tricarboxylate transporter substrate-binding protein n=1 Tax=Salipiger sp. IMCC34102 TaxID=2510647 RepID=UPI00101BE672|nr:tripartite tricarboxylate transporter substrate-binding protein [Salipiger sp. IMCC34102]RYH02630.1 tripartite tricarboxylate transporter substrate binding protein [Salipiger sp. IMCC34102]